MIDFEALTLGPAYSLIARDAVYTPVAGAPVNIKVIDETQGKAIDSAGPGSPVDIVPAVNVRKADVAENPAGGTITLDAIVWPITRSIPVLGPKGLSSGELTLILEKP